MVDGDILIVKASEVVSLLTGREDQIIEKVRMAYEAHARGESSLPHSTFLNFPDSPRDRIIALPAFLGGDCRMAGVKWVSSFPGNLSVGLDRASAVVILNSLETGRPEAILEGSVISAKRTAASAALAAQRLFPAERSPRLGLIGCGLINLEITRFLRALWPDLEIVSAYDVDPARTRQFQQKCRDLFDGMACEVVLDVKDVLRSASLISFATTALQPYITDLSGCAPDSVLLHISLRDIAVRAILACDNIVDDVDHVCRANTSIHLAEQQVGRRNFIRCTLADILQGSAPTRRDDRSPAVFSPFGLGVLDLAVAQLVYQSALEQNRGIAVDSFLPDSWTRTTER